MREDSPADEPGRSSRTPIAPSPDQRLPCTRCDAPHPSVLEVDDLLTDCDFRTQSRSGPGGQHRNRTASGVFVTHRPSDLIAEATEQRNQHRNRAVAIQRLRYVFAISLRTQSPIDGPLDAELATLEIEVRERARGTPMKMADDNVAKPAVLAMLLNDLHASGGQPSLVGPLWNVSTSRLIACVRSHPASWAYVNRIRSHHQRPSLR